MSVNLFLLLTLIIIFSFLLRSLRGKLKRALNDMNNNIHADSECVSKCERFRAYFKQESPYVCKFRRTTGNPKLPSLLMRSLPVLLYSEMEDGTPPAPTLPTSTTMSKTRYICYILAILGAFSAFSALLLFFLGYWSCPFGSGVTCHGM